MSGPADPWEALHDSIAQAPSPNVRAALDRAKAANVDPATYSGIMLRATDWPSDSLPVLYFGDWRGGDYTAIWPTGGGQYTSLTKHRGEAG